MWSRQILQRNPCKSLRLRRQFGGPSHHQQAHHSESEGAEIVSKEEITRNGIGKILGFMIHTGDLDNRHNPYFKDLKWTEILKNVKPSTGMSLISALAKEANTIDSERPVSEVFNPPRIHENSIFLYQSVQIANILRPSRRLEIPLYIGLALAFPSFVVGSVIFAVTYITSLRATQYELSNRLVVRMDLLPHLEMISFQKIGFGGRIVTKLVRLVDLEKVEVDIENESAFWRYTSLLDRDLMYRDKSTGELFVFDGTGLWSWQGISHKLLY